MSLACERESKRWNQKVRVRPDSRGPWEGAFGVSLVGKGVTERFEQGMIWPSGVGEIMNLTLMVIIKGQKTSE